MWQSPKKRAIGIRLWRTVQDSNPRLRLRRPEGYPDYPNGPRFIPARPTRLQSAGWQSTTSRDRLLWTLTGAHMDTAHPVSSIRLRSDPHSIPMTCSPSETGPKSASGLDGSIVHTVPSGLISFAESREFSKISRPSPEVQAFLPYGGSKTNEHPSLLPHF